MKAQKSIAIVFSMVLMVLLCTTPAAADPIPAGSDIFITPVPTCMDAESYEDFLTAPIPADFFGPGSDPFDGTIYWVGAPFSVPGGGEADTIVERLEAADVSVGGEATVDIQIKALSLVSQGPITITFDGGTSGSAEYNVEVCLSSAFPQGTGSMTIHQRCAEGGRFDSTLPVIPKLTFTKISGALGLPTAVLDTGTLYNLISKSTCWSHSAGAFAGDLYATTGGTVDHDCDGGTAEISFSASTGNFFVGVCDLPCTADYAPIKKALRPIIDYIQRLKHMFLPAMPLTPDTDDDGWPDIMDTTPDECGPYEIPALSQWGLVVMALLGVTVGTIVFVRRRKVAT
ncbi:MAG: hypothetical protein JSU63_21915 [Phycisphaerales bacterium]|nr:MAG: hypothetical protein JSU63_21915 [Phycisphaerales bacterium]